MPAFWTNWRASCRCSCLVAMVLAAMPMAWMSNAAKAAPAEEALLIPEQAQDLFLMTRGPASRQISYTMELTYPARAIGEAQWKRLRDAGWVRCRSLDPGQEEANTDWIHFVDGTVSPKRTVHQHLSNWSKGDQMIMISLRYYSSTRDGNRRSKPDNRDQHVDLIFDDHHSPEMAEWLQLDCSH
jgi:hypothetical protein